MLLKSESEADHEFVKVTTWVISHAANEKAGPSSQASVAVGNTFLCSRPAWQQDEDGMHYRLGGDAIQLQDSIELKEPSSTGGVFPKSPP